MNNKKQQIGAVLLAVLVVALALVILLGVVSHALNNRMKLAQQAKENLQDTSLVYGKLNELSYLLATQRVTVAGLSRGTSKDGLLRDSEGHWLLRVIGDEIRIDGENNREESGLEYSLQEHKGLIPINSSGQFWLKRWLRGYGIAITQQARYADVLADYADADNWRRPSGAEQQDYINAQLSAPANFLLQSCNELYKLVEWQNFVSRHPEVINQCGLERIDSLNLNAIPITLWRILWPDSAAKLAMQREQNHWLMDTRDILAVEPSILTFDEDNYSIFGGNQYSIVIDKNGVHVEVIIKLGNSTLAPITFNGAY